VTLLGLVLFLARGESILNVDFTKGTVYGGRLKEGQERALSNTDKRGFLTLLGETAQKEKLAVKDAVLAQPGDLDGQNINENVYELTYADNSKAVVTFVNRPEGPDAAARREDVLRRASQLPGLSIEQVFLGGESFGSNKSRSFTVRTTEKEPELVQISLDRLLRDETTGESLLASTQVSQTKFEGLTATVNLTAPASPRYLESFVERELKLMNRWPSVTGVRGLTVEGIKTEDNLEVSTQEGRSGRFLSIRIDASMNPEFKALKEALDAKKPIAGDKTLETAQADFQRAVNQALAVFTSRPMPDRLETFDPALAAETRAKAFYAILASWLAILLYLWFRFGNWTFGLAAVLCLIHDLCFTLGIIAVCHYIYDNPLGQLLLLQDFKIDLAAVAALLTLIGFSVNDTIVVFDRIREVRGKNPLLTPQIINDSVNQTLSRTVLASVTVFLVVGVLYFFGGEGVHLFSFVMVVGVIIGTFSSIYVASPLLLIFGEGQPKTPTGTAGLAGSSSSSPALSGGK
jgi:SecD/SecF fusion protein